MSERDYQFGPHSNRSLVDLLQARASVQPEQIGYAFLVDGATQELTTTYSELDQRARTIAAKLQELCVPGDRVLLLYPPGLEYIAAFFGCLYAGVIAVPSYPPRLNRPDARLQAIVDDARPVVALTTSAILAGIDRRLAQMPALTEVRWLATDSVRTETQAAYREAELRGDTLAFLQYTSGSTAAPKGVMLTHDNLLHNLASIHRHFRASHESRGVIWLPPYHDMGLIGGILAPLYGGFPVTLMSPLAFLERPLRWLQTISQTAATISGGPNFAYELCVRKITPEERESLDLSTWELAFNGAEPIRNETLERFAETFSPCGFRRAAFYPCYGLAEATLLVSGPAQLAEPTIDHFQAAALQDRQVVPMAEDQHGGRTLVGCGQSLFDQRLVIVDPGSLSECAPGWIGEIWVCGASVAQGYWNRPEETKDAFCARLSDGEGTFLRTGDLGFLSEGELFVAGRLKDLMIIRGRNYYPQDIELTVERSHAALRAGAGVGFAVDRGGDESLIVVQELERAARKADVEEVSGAIRRAVAEEHELQVHAVVLIKPGSLPKTSSGKVQRRLCKSRFLNGELDVIGQSTLGQESAPVAVGQGWDQTARLRAAGLDEQHMQAAVQLWEHVAHLAKVPAAGVDPQQPLTALGLDSLGAVELRNYIETALGVSLSVAALLQGPTLVELAVMVTSHKQTTHGQPSTASAAPPETPQSFPLSANQRALWYLYQLAPDSAAYTVARALRIHGPLDVAALHRALQLLVHRHPALRTVFRASGSEPVQEVLIQAEVFFRQEDASGWSASFLHQRIAEEAHRSFQLEQGPLMRVYLYTRTAQEHVLLFAAHHIVVDFRALVIVLSEIQAFYEQERTGVPCSLLPPLAEYSDYVHWQSELLRSGDGKQLFSYWQRQLAGHQPALEFPADRPRPLVQSDRGATHFFKLPPPLSDRLRSLARDEGATLYTTLLAGYLAMLYRYTGQEDILVGSAAAARSSARFMDLVGYFVNPVVLRGNLNGSLCFRDLLRQVRQTVLSAVEHQDYPLVDLVDRLHPVRDPSRSPLFQVMFTYLQAPHGQPDAIAALGIGEPGAQLAWGELTLESLPLAQESTQFDLLLTMAEASGALSGSFQYATSLFDPDTIARMAGHFQRLLESIAADPGQPISGVQLLTPEEHQRLTSEWNQTAEDMPPSQTFHALFEATVQQYPDAVAVAHGAQQLTYSDLNRRANQLARYLRGLGVGPDTAVGLCVERSLELAVGLLGILKAGGYYVPLDPAYPPARLAYMLADCNAPLLVTQQRLGDRVADTGARQVRLDADWPAIAREEGSNLVSSAVPENLAYMIYTSGSTGRPKGVMVPHTGLVNYLTWSREAYTMGAGAGAPVHSSVAFDLTVTSLLGPLVSGKRVVLVPEELGPAGLADAFRQESDFTLVKLTPAHLKLLGEQLNPAEAEGRTRTFIIGGENLMPDQIRFWQSAAPGTALVNEYGPTETVVGCCVYRVPEGQQYTGAIPIGRPIRNTQLYILDQSLQPVPVGVIGELYIGGAGVARGYYGRPDLTAERFVPDPFGGKSGARLYRTGDQARFRSDGVIECLGRMDEQVKVSGFRIELGEVESALAHHPGLREATVVVKGDNSDERYLAAYSVPREGVAPSAGELRSFLRESLPAYMIPSLFVTLEALPLTPNGKFDRRALAQMHHTEPVAAHEQSTAPLSEVEQIISEVWQSVLPVSHPGVQDNFFDLGGNSLLLMRVQKQLEERLQRTIPLVEVLKHPTVTSLASYLSQSPDASGRNSLAHTQARAEGRLAARELRREFRHNRK